MEEKVLNLTEDVGLSAISSPACFALLALLIAASIFVMLTEFSVLQPKKPTAKLFCLACTPCSFQGLLNPYNQPSFENWLTTDSSNIGFTRLNLQVIFSES